MKKSLIALAVLAASGAAMAQSSVTLYGIADAAFAKTKGANAQFVSGGDKTSRLGFKGSEDLGGGLQANFLLEQAIDLTAGTGGNFNRQSYVGLSGGFGEFKIGKVWTAYDDIAAAADPVFDSNLLDPTNIWASHGYAANPNSNFYYATPSFGGFSGAFSHSLDGSKNDVKSFHVKYEGGPIYAGLAYQDDSEIAGGKYTRLNGTYDFGSFKLLAGYGNTKPALGAAKTTDLSIGADVPLSSNLVLSAGYASSKPKGGARESGLGFGVSYSLSKRTSVYGGYVDFNSAAGNGDTVAAGIKHTF